MAVEKPAEPSAGGTVRGARLNREVLAGLFLIVSAAIGYYAALPLDAGSMSGVGSGLLPKAVAIGLCGFGIYLIIAGLVGNHERVEGFSESGVAHSVLIHIVRTGAPASRNASRTSARLCVPKWKIEAASAAAAPPF